MLKQVICTQCIVYVWLTNRLYGIARTLTLLFSLSQFLVQCLHQLEISAYWSGQGHRILLLIFHMLSNWRINQGLGILTSLCLCVPHDELSMFVKLLV